MAPRLRDLADAGPSDLPPGPVAKRNGRRTYGPEFPADLAALGIGHPDGVADLEPRVELIERLDGFLRGGEPR